MEIKVGSKVIYLRHADKYDATIYKIDKVYTVKKAHVNTYTLDGFDYAVIRSQIAPIIKNNKLARKMYPKAEEKGEWLIIW
jgi:hypothetical protein